MAEFAHREAAVGGHRAYLVVLAGVTVLALLMLAAPVARYLEGRARLELLETKHRALQGEIARLEARGRDLREPGQVELLAREQLGLVRPGEVLYVVTTPEDERLQVAPVSDRPPTAPWYRRVWEAVGDVVR